MKKVLFLLHENFEEIELVVPLDILRRAGIFVQLASTSWANSITGAHGIVLSTEHRLADFASNCHETFDALAIPGGPGIEELRGNESLYGVFRRFKAANKFVCAICAAPLILKDAGILPERYTGYPSIANELPDITGETCVVSDKIITANGPCSAFEFGFEIAKALTDEKTVVAMKKAMCCK